MAIRGILVRLAMNLFAGLSATLANAQDDVLSLEPTSDWEVVQDGDTCTISRHFGVPANGAELFLRSRDPWNGGFHLGIKSSEFIWTGKAIEAGWLPNGVFAKRPLPSIEVTENDAQTLLFEHGLWDAKLPKRSDDSYEAYWAKNDDGESVGPMSFKRSVEGLLIKSGFDHPLFFATGPMDAVIDARDQCIRTMMTAMGIDPTEEDRDTHRVTLVNALEMMNAIPPRTPASIAHPDNKSRVSFMLYVDDRARISACRLISLPYDAEFQEFACDLLSRRAKLEFKAGEARKATFFKFHYPPTGSPY